MRDIALSGEQALEELHELLRHSCQQQAPARQSAVRYQICRTAVMATELKSYLPGFVTQCVSLIKFREFICLYDHDPAARIRFVDRSLENCWTRLNQGPAHDTFDVDDF
jgi:hypothetical protein